MKTKESIIPVEIKNMFPIEATVSFDMLNTMTDKKRGHAHLCLGAKLLKSVLPEALADKVFWAKTFGAIYSSNGKINVSTEEQIDFTKLFTPTKITFILRKLNE